MTALALGLAMVLAQPAAKDSLVGRVIVIGNTLTHQDVILYAAGVQPGQRFDEDDLAVCKARLERLRIFKLVSLQSIPDPTQPAKTEFRAVLIQVEEGRSADLRIMAGWSRSGVPVVSLVWEERNFDPWAWPRNWEHCVSGEPFRGAGQLFRLELIQVPLLPNCPVRLMQWGSWLLRDGSQGSHQAPGDGLWGVTRSAPRAIVGPSQDPSRGA